MAARRERGLCFKCDEQFNPGHKCRPKFQCLILEDEKPSGGDDDVLQTEEASHDIVPAISYHAMQGCLVPRTIRLTAELAGRQVMVLVDGGSTHNFLQSRVAKSAGLVVEATRHLRVTVGNGDELWCRVCVGEFAFYWEVRNLWLIFICCLSMGWMLSLGHNGWQMLGQCVLIIRTCG
ncbi:hypothetical protein QQ045_001553 [Rhodiola kirilowii]